MVQACAVPDDPSKSVQENLRLQHFRIWSLGDKQWREHRAQWLAREARTQQMNHNPYAAVPIGQASVSGPLVDGTSNWTDNYVVTHTSRNIHGLRHNLHAVLRDKCTHSSLQETDLNGAQVNQCTQDASASGYHLHFGKTCPLGKDAKGPWGRRTAVLSRSPMNNIINHNDANVLSFESGRWIERLILLAN